jgi:hypothetical protein
MVLLLLLGLLPATSAAAPPKAPFVMVRDWTLPVDPKNLPIGAFLSAWDVSWRAPRAATVELGYVYCVGGRCSIAVEATHTVTKDDKYPQNLRLTAWEGHWLVAGNCTLQQFVHVRDRSGQVVADAWSLQDRICMDY